MDAPAALLHGIISIYVLSWINRFNVSFTKIKEEGQPVIDRWLEVLKAGGTKTPQELMEYAGVDMTSPEPIKKAVNYVGSLVDDLVKSYQESATNKFYPLHKQRVILSLHIDK